MRIKQLKIDKLIDIIFLGKAWDEAFLVTIDSLFQIISRTDVGYISALIADNVKLPIRRMQI